MPSALETLVKILKLEQDMGYQDKAVIGGLRSFAVNWARDAHAQAKKPEHHALIDELGGLLERYADLAETNQRHEAIRHMLGRITGRVPPPAATAPPKTGSSPPVSPPEDEPAPAAPLPAVASAAPPQDDPAAQRQTTPAAGEPPLPAPDKPFPPPRREHREREGPPRRRRAEGGANLKVPVTDISGIGPKIGEKLGALGLRTVEDWLFFFPRRYDDYSRMLPLNRLKPGMDVTVVGSVRNAAVIKGRRGIDVLSVTIADGTGTLTASFFGQPYLRAKFERGTQVVFSGRTGIYQGRVTMDNPEWEMFDSDALHTRSIVPVYPLTKGLSAHAMRRLSRRLVDLYVDSLVDYMPESALERVNLPDLSWAVQQMHFPDSAESLALARRRLAFDDLMLLQLAVLRNRRAWQSQPGVPLPADDGLMESLFAALPYTLTGAQNRALQVIREDMAKPIPMNRLLQGDVGAGKTVVAALSMLIAVANGYQAALMAPTGILAEQHYASITNLIRGLPGGERLNIKLLTSATPPQERSETLWGLGEGSVHIIIGTHALIQEDVYFWKLGLAVIDEQHRFGVEQRGRLRGKGMNPHVLIMTATPIPRTLALTLFADLDLTVLDEMPPGRTPIQTKVLKNTERERAFQFIDTQVEKGHQAFIVYPLVESEDGAEAAEVRSATRAFEFLQDDVFPRRRLGLLHGRMSPAQKDLVMGAFSRGELDILVSTSVIEVGIDVPNATVILIEGANRFGLAQLHQLRGRVGRGQHSSFCLLISEDGDLANPRLKAMEDTTDGFRLAELDWQLRGAGDLLGTRQSGKVKNTEGMDIKLVEEAQVEARTIYEQDPDLVLPEHRALKARIDELFGVGESADVS